MGAKHRRDLNAVPQHKTGEANREAAPIEPTFDTPKLAPLRLPHAVHRRIPGGTCSLFRPRTDCHDRWIVLPQYSGAVSALNSLELLSPLRVLIAVVLELASLAVYCVLTDSILGPVH